MQGSCTLLILNNHYHSSCTLFWFILKCEALNFYLEWNQKTGKQISNCLYKKSPEMQKHQISTCWQEACLCASIKVFVNLPGHIALFCLSGQWPEEPRWSWLSFPACILCQCDSSPSLPHSRGQAAEEERAVTLDKRREEGKHAVDRQRDEEGLPSANPVSQPAPNKGPNHHPQVHNQTCRGGIRGRKRGDSVKAGGCDGGEGRQRAR